MINMDLYKMGKQSRMYFQKHFNREILLNQIERYFV